MVQSEPERPGTCQWNRPHYSQHFEQGAEKQGAQQAQVLVVRGAQVADVSEVVDDVFHGKAHSLPVTFTTKPHSRQVPAGVIRWSPPRGWAGPAKAMIRRGGTFLLLATRKLILCEKCEHDVETQQLAFQQPTTFRKAFRNEYT